MNKTIKIIISVVSGLFFLIRCNDREADDSPYSKIRETPPYDALTDSIRKDPKAELYFRRAVLLNQNDLTEPALEDFWSAWHLEKKEETALAISRLLLEKNRVSAIGFLNTALKELPKSFLLRLTLARAYAPYNQDEALKICDSLLHMNPEQVDVLKMKADLLEKKSRIRESIATLEKAYNLAPQDVELNYMLALKYAENKNSRILRLCDSLINQDSANMHAEPYYYKGIYFSNINEKARALEQFSLAISHDYYFLDAYIEKGVILFEQKKYNDALKVFQLAHDISATFADAYYWMGRCQEALGQKAEAKSNYHRAYGLDKTFLKAKEAAERIQN